MTSDIARPRAGRVEVADSVEARDERDDAGDGRSRPGGEKDRPIEDTGIVAPRFEFRPHNCFACGSLNAQGLQLVLHVEHRRAWTELSLDRRFEGWEGIAHGGILCTILDEVMAWSLVANDNWGLTARMAVSFLKPVPVGRAIRADGSVVRARRRLHETTSRLVDVETGVTLATAEGTYLAADAERKRELQERYLFRVVEP